MVSIQNCRRSCDFEVFDFEMIVIAVRNDNQGRLNGLKPELETARGKPVSIRPDIS